MSPFAQSLCRAQISILEIFHIFLRLKFSPSSTLVKIEHFSKVSPTLDWFCESLIIRLRETLHLRPEAGRQLLDLRFLESCETTLSLHDEKFC